MRVGIASERGSVVPMFLVVGCVIALGVLGLSRLGDAAVKRAQADAVADLVALAAVADGQRAAEQVSRASRASLTGFESIGLTAVRVTVLVDGVSASAAAAELGEEIPAPFVVVGNPGSEILPR
ncbi:MAG: hypothetical protein WD029_00255 [Microthrixaceae bacterium]